MQSKNDNNFTLENKVAIIKFIFSALFVIIISLLVYNSKITNVEKLESIMKEYSHIAPLIYILLFSVLPTFFAPVTIMAIAAGFAFGIARAFIYTFIAAFINSSITYFYSKYFAKALVEKFAKSRYPDIYEKINRYTHDGKGITFMAVLRTLPFIPYTALNYISGALGYDYKNFIVGTMVGIIPGMIIYINIGTQSTNIRSIGFILSIVLFIVFCIVTSLVVKIFYNKKENKAGHKS